MKKTNGAVVASALLAVGVFASPAQADGFPGGTFRIESFAGSEDGAWNCLSADISRYVVPKACDGSDRQKWTWNSRTGQLSPASHPTLCASDGLDEFLFPKVELRPCVSGGSPSQEWEYEPDDHGSVRVQHPIGSQGDPEYWYWTCGERVESACVTWPVDARLPDGRFRVSSW
ncbi:hypothetical protein [Streptomyces sp. NPDC003077]|uniref:hypothetical protein n=1 Tax=Streptomyces sp. NPDC003077 TaxID=3154443 RepID=UPI0033A1ACFD